MARFSFFLALLGAWSSTALAVTVPSTPSTVTDGVSTVAVKAASTPAAATDPALVVSVSPNNTVSIQGGNSTAVKVDGSAVTQPVSSTQLPSSLDGAGYLKVSQSNKSTSGSITNVGDTASVDCNGADVVRIQVQGTWSGTLTIEGTVDSGTNWFAASAYVGGTSPFSANITSNQTIKIGPVSGFTNVRVRATAMSSGTANVTLSAGAGPNLVQVYTGGTSDFYSKVTDGTNSAAVKAASTAAATTDPALVVAVSPNNIVSINSPDTVGSTAALGSLNATATVTMAGASTVGMQLAAGTLIGTVIPEASMDGGTTWVQTFFDNPTTAAKVSSLVFSSSNTAQTYTIVSAGGASNIRVRVSAYTSGTANVTLRATQSADPSVLFSGPQNTAAPPTVAQIGGVFNTALPTITSGNVSAIQLDSSGRVIVGSVAGALPAGTNTIGSVKITDGTNTATVKAASTAAAAADQAQVVVQSPNGTNPCQNPSANLQSVFGATSGTSSVQLVALSGSTRIYVCSITVTGVSGTTPTFSMVYGTGTACATGQTKMLGPINTTAGTALTFGGSNYGVTPAGNALCYLDGGTSPVQNYAITYVQQ